MRPRVTYAVQGIIDHVTTRMRAPVRPPHARPHTADPLHKTRDSCRITQRHKDGGTCEAGARHRALLAFDTCQWSLRVILRRQWILLPAHPGECLT